LKYRALPVLLALVSGAAAIAVACNDESLAGTGDACILHTDCSSGICAEAVCVSQSLDTDGDGEINADELAAGSDPLNPDSDGDGRPDGEEIGADPKAPLDGDGDGIPDFRESALDDRDLDGENDQSDPTDDVPDLDQGLPCVSAADCGDGICIGGQCYGADNDLDQDGLTNGDERTLGTNPINPDSDADGDRDQAEVGDDVARPTDTDGDGRIDARESNTVDSDGDGTPDQADPN
jgi:hypothetical protein